MEDAELVRGRSPTIDAPERILLLTGGPSDRWRVLARQFRQGLGPQWQGELTEDGQTGDTDARTVIFIEHPARTLEALAIEGRLHDPEQALQQWTSLARRWLARTQAGGQRPLLVDVDEALADPPALAATASGWLGLDLVPTEPTPVHRSEPLLQWAAERRCALDRKLVRLHEELLATSTPLVESAPQADDEPTLAPALSAVQLGSVLHHVQRLLEIERQAPELSRERTTLLLNLHETQRQLEQTGLQLEAAQGQIQELEPQLSRSKAEGSLFLTQLHLMQAELETLLTGKAELVAQLADAAALKHSREAQQLLARADLELLIRQRDEAVTRLEKQLQSRLQSQQDVLARALLDREQMALELYRLIGSGSSQAAPVHEQPAFAGLAESLDIEHVRDEAPHRELSLVASQAWLGELAVPQLRFRLVDHLGRAGLSVLEGEIPALSQWQATGREDDLEYMLLIPDDEHGRDRLLRLGSKDWKAVLAMVDLAVLACCEHGAQLKPHWAVVAARLRQQLEDLPARLRYDELELQPLSDQSRRLYLRGALFGDRVLPEASLRWQPGQADSLVWELTQAQALEPPAPSWPVQADGMLAAQWSLKSAVSGGSRARAQWWRQRSDQERELLLGLLDCLGPAAAQAGGQGDALAGALTASATLMRQAAAQALRWNKTRALLLRRR